MKTASIILIIGAVAAGIILLSQRSGSSSGSAPANNVTVVDGKQIVEIAVRGGYRPSRSVAQAGIPTILRMKTNGTFDCSLALRVPSKNISQILPQSGSTDFDLGSPAAGTLNGMCGMGMYRFAIEFK